MRGKSVYLLQLGVTLLTGCSEGFKAISATNTQLSCPVSAPAQKTVATKSSESVFTANKIQLSRALISNNRPREYVATIDMACVRSNQTPFRSAKIRLKNRQPKSINFKEGLVSARVELNNISDEAELVEIVQRENCVVGISDDLSMQRQALPDDPYLAKQQNLTAIGFANSYDFYSSSVNSNSATPVIIALVDDGINLQHPDLSANIWSNIAELNGQAGVDDDGNGYVDDIQGYDFMDDVGDPSHKVVDVQHGTHVAGLAAAITNNGVGISGVITKNVKIMALNVFGSEDGTTASTIDEAIRYAADNGADVINLSLGGEGTSASTLSAINYAISLGVVVVAAAGNESVQLSTTKFYAPASYAKDVDGFISVGAANASNTASICNFSNFSSTYVEIVASGCDSQQTSGLLSTLSGTSYARHNGTSMATPQVAGAAALAILAIKSRTGVRATPAEVENLLRNAAKTETTLLTKVSGGKHLDIGAMADYIGLNYSLSTASICN